MHRIAVMLGNLEGAWIHRCSRTGSEPESLNPSKLPPVRQTETDRLVGHGEHVALYAPSRLDCPQ